MTAASQKPYDLFVVSSERAQDNDCIRLAMDGEGKTQDDLSDEVKSSPIPAGPWEIVPANARATPIGGARDASTRALLRQRFWRKLSAAVVGAGFLIGPLWLLSLQRELFVQLEATTAFVFGFGLLLAWVVDEPHEVFAGTLAYAAVLVVFVGVSVQGGGASSNTA